MVFAIVPLIIITIGSMIAEKHPVKAEVYFHLSIFKVFYDLNVKYLVDCALTLDCQSPSLECVVGKCTNSSSQQYYEEFNKKIQPLKTTVQPNAKSLIYGEGIYFI